MENKEYNTYLKILEENHSKKNKDEKDYLERCKANKNLNPKDYKIQTNHKLEEYFAMYGKKLEKGKLLAYKKNELWLMNKKTTYWEIENESDFVYFETQKNLKPLWISLAAVLAVGAIVGGITAGVILSRGSGDKEEYKGLKFTALEAGSKVGFKIYPPKTHIIPGVRIQYSTDLYGEKWTNWFGQELILKNVNDFIYIKNTGNTLCPDGDTSFVFNMSGRIAASGNINSMINFSELSEWCYNYMFEDCTSLVSAPALPATTLAEHCYDYMFYGCTSLTQAPELPATTLAECCYENMFEGCTSLTSAPILPATTLAERCYYNMFKGCTSLTQVPELPFVQIEHGCYNNMFENCSSLKIRDTMDPNIVNKIFTCIDGSYAYNNMFNGTGGDFAGTPNDGKTYFWYEYE